MANFQNFWLSLILRVARKIWKILQISAVIFRILQIPRGTANCKPKFLSKKLAKVCSQKILQSSSVVTNCHFLGFPLLENFRKLCYG